MAIAMWLRVYARLVGRINRTKQANENEKPVDWRSMAQTGRLQCSAVQQVGPQGLTGPLGYYTTGHLSKIVMVNIATGVLN